LVTRNNGRSRFVVVPIIGLSLGCQPQLNQGPAPAVADPAQAPTLAAKQVSDADAPLLSAARNSRAAVLRDLENLVNIDSGTEDAEGLARVSQLLAQRLKDLGATVERLAAPPAAGPVVRGTFAGTGSARIMLMVHFDTVFPKGEAAKRPFKVVGNKAFGPGVADAKGGIAILLHALQLARQRGFDNYKTLTVLFNSDEETGSLGSHEMIRASAAQHDYVLSYEPPDQERVIVATNGVAYVQLRVTGRASHAGAAPEKGRNAAVELAGQILQLKALGDPARGTTVNWTRLESGDRINIIPDKAEATADMRMSDMAEIARVQKDANDVIRKRLVPDTDVTVNVELRRPPFSRNAPSERLATMANRIYRELGKSIEPVAMRYGTDAGFAYQPGNATPAVLEGLGVVGDGLHTGDEWADLDSVPPRLYLTVRMLELLGKGAALR
jgi:glutamate carboxypeptidase